MQRNNHQIHERGSGYRGLGNNARDGTETKDIKTISKYVKQTICVIERLEELSEDNLGKQLNATMMDTLVHKMQVAEEVSPPRELWRNPKRWASVADGVWVLRHATRMGSRGASTDPACAIKQR